MLRLIDIDESNWLEAAHLSVTREQSGYVADAIGIIARGYVYRDSNARVWCVAKDDTIVGLAMVRNLDEEPACYDLQQLMIDAKYQNRGYGTQALLLILDKLKNERHYECVEVCVKRVDAPALRIYKKVGFADTGYIDEEALDCVNLMLYFD